ncbi:helix-turn-helix domain-containing protein [Amycolatopsis cihanbeyliensis]|uniref:helix-turn-helix domain-containing protein n=1 Tax=Amycolatopsis cihanbeyliensis TaxID=1128664 RepID=UPI001FEB8E1F|nr:helix-turn-helix domain-containing protein [Amycolatopsis cihanbeyliensis]
MLRCAEGGSIGAAAADIGVSRNTVSKWRSRFVADRLEGSFGAEAVSAAACVPVEGSSTAPNTTAVHKLHPRHSRRFSTHHRAPPSLLTWRGAVLYTASHKLSHRTQTHTHDVKKQNPDALQQNPIRGRIFRRLDRLILQ